MTDQEPRVCLVCRKSLDDQTEQQRAETPDFCEACRTTDAAALAKRNITGKKLFT